MSPRMWWMSVAGVLALVLGAPAAARADERSDRIAGALRETGIYVTDHAPRAIGPEDIPRLRKMLEPIPVPTFLAVTPNLGAGAVNGKPLAAVLHDRLARDGLYLVMDESGIYFDGLQFGPGAVPVDDAARAASYELPYDAGPFLKLERFVDVVTSGDEEARARATKAQNRSRKDEDYPMSFRDRRERQQWHVEAGSTAAGAVAVMALIHWLRRRRRPADTARSAGAFATAVVAIMALGPPALPNAFAARDPGPTTASDPGGGAGPSGDRIDRVVAGLERSPLFIDADLGHLVPPAERPGLEAALRDAGVPVYVVVMPQMPDDESQGLGRELLVAVHERSGRPGVYLAVDDQGSIDVENFDVPRDVDIDFGLRSPPNFDQPVAVPPRLAAVIETIRQSPPGTPYSPERYSTAEPVVREQPSPNLPSDQLRRSAAIGFFIVGPIVGLLLYFLGFLVAIGIRGVQGARRVGSATAPGPGGLPLRAPNAPAEPDLRWLREQAEAELSALNAALDHADFADAAAGRRSTALTAYDAAALLLGSGKDDPLGLVAAVVLARDGRRALQPSRALLVVPCAINPLHGPASRRRQLPLLGRPARLTPVCPACVGLAAATAGDRMLRLRDDGEARPYLSLPGFWPDPSEATGPILAARVREYLGVH